MPNQQLTLDAPAKVNLVLKIAGRRPDGMHQLVTLMQPISLADRLTVRVGEGLRGLDLTCNRSELTGGDNLVLKAARAFFAAVGREPAAGFHLQKNIPVAAGLGGGSSDAAAALMALNALTGSPLGPADLAGLAAGLGADVPFFLGGVTAWCTGIGEIVRPVEDFPLLDYVLVNPGFELSTAWIYQQFDLAWTTGYSSSTITGPLRRSLTWQEALVNDLEPVALKAHSELARMQDLLRGQGAMATRMSGSGPTTYGVFADSARARRAADELRAHGGIWVIYCRGIAA